MQNEMASGSSKSPTKFIFLVLLGAGASVCGGVFVLHVILKLDFSWSFIITWIAMSFSFATYNTFFDNREKQRRLRQEIQQIEKKAEIEPEKAKFAWDLARVKLEEYFDRNLTQVSSVFRFAILTMTIGFGFVLWGITIAGVDPTHQTAWVAALSGIVTEFIGVTVMVIYRSTMAQANSFMEVLERINTVGMAVQILDSIPDGEAQLKNATRTELVKLLLSGVVRAKKEGVIAKRAGAG